jgi:hypothetical protein
MLWPILTPTPALAADLSTVRSGNWSDPAVWSSGQIPAAGDSVTIGAGHTIVYDVNSDAILGKIEIHGVLSLSRTQTTRLRTRDHVIVHAGGYLNQGTWEDPIAKSARAEVIWTLTQAEADSYEGGQHFADKDKGLWVMGGGRWDAHGAPLLRTWSKLAGTVPAGATTLLVENDVSDWIVGGQVVVTTTGHPQRYSVRSSDGREASNYTDESEVRTLVSLERVENGTRLVLDQPLQYEHLGVAPFQGEVALLTRNLLFQTEIIGKDEAEYADVRERKFAHTLYLPNAQGDLQYVEFKRMGHYGALGRYAIHHHMMEESSQGMVVRGNAGWQTGFRCLNLHITHGVLVEDNVCYDSSSTAYFVEHAEEGQALDNLFVHNIAISTRPKHFNDRSDTSVHGEYLGYASFWPGSGTVNEVFLGNVAVGGEPTKSSSGFQFPSTGNGAKDVGTIPFTFVGNEVHGVGDHGIASWQNNVPAREMVGVLVWRNGTGGITWGAYAAPFRYYNAQILENAIFGLSITSIQSFVQDSIITGTTADESLEDMGLFIKGYVSPQYPNPPAMLIRNTFQNLKTFGIAQESKIVSEENPCKTFDFDPGPPDLLIRAAYPGDCSAVYLTMLGNRFEDVPRPLLFGPQANPNSWWKILDPHVNGVDQPSHVLMRADQNQPLAQSILSKQLVTPAAVHDSSADALSIPADSLPASIEFHGLLNHRSLEQQNRGNSADFTFSTAVDYPPQISIEVHMDGQMATVTATASDDKQIERIEFLVDWMQVETVTSAPYQVQIDLSKHPRRYAYLYARAFDGAHPFDEATGRSGSEYEQKAYSNVVVIGPEILPQTLVRHDLYLPFTQR